jgi:hypothetical protein
VVQQAGFKTMKRIILAGTLLLSLALPAAAQTIRANEQWFGLYTVEGVETIDDASAPGGKRRVGGKIKEPAVNSDRIQHTPGSYFGFGYTLTGAPDGQTIPVRHVQVFPPPGVRDSTGKLFEKIETNLISAPDATSSSGFRWATILPLAYGRFGSGRTTAYCLNANSNSTGSAEK